MDKNIITGKRFRDLTLLSRKTRHLDLLISPAAKASLRCKSSPPSTNMGLPFEASTSSSGTKLRTISVSKFQDGTAESIKACIENQLKDYGVLSVHVPNPSFAFAYALIGGENRDEKSFETLEHELGEKDEAVVVCGLLVRYANLKPHILGEEGLNAPGPVVNPTKQGCSCCRKWLARKQLERPQE